MTAIKTANRKTSSPISRTRGRPSLEEVAEIDGQLLEVALREFIRSGYGGTSMTQIVKAANISKSTLYSRYSSKEQLFRAIIFQQMDRALAATLMPFQTGRYNLEEGLIAYAERSLEISFKGGLLGVNRLIFSESHRFPELGVAAYERSQIGAQHISAFIRDWATSEGRTVNDADAAAEAFILMMRGYYVNTMLTNRPTPPSVRQQWVRRSVKAFVAGACGW